MLSSKVPTYMADDIHLASENSARSLRSSMTIKCSVTRVQSRFGDRYFAAAGPRIWNNLPASLWDKEVSCTEFRRQLKTYMLQTVCSASWPFWLLHLINTLTYLHVSQYTHAHTVSCTRVYRSSIIICVVHHTAHINIGYGQFVRILLS